MSDAPPPRALLVRAPNWLGDCVMALPALRALRQVLPSARIAVEARPGVAPVFRWTRDADEVVACPAGGGLRNLRERLRHAAALGERGFDAGLLLPNSFSTALLLWQSGVPRRIGTDVNLRGGFLTDRVERTPALREAHQAEWYLALAARLGADPALTDPVLAPPADEEGKGSGDKPDVGAATGDRPYAVLAPGSAYGPAKEWPPDCFAALAKRLAEDGLAVIVTGGPGDAALAEAVVADAGPGAVNLAGKTSLDGFLRLLAGAHCFAGNDSGAAHCAAALGLPAAVVFGSTRPGRTRPLGARVRTLVGEAPCAPCLRRTCARRSAPRACLRSVTPDAVRAALREAGADLADAAADTGARREPA